MSYQGEGVFQDGGSLQCYRLCSDQYVRCFPFHKECLQLLERCISGTTPAVPSLHKRTLYETMEGFYEKEHTTSFLNIDYGFHNMIMDQIWMPNIGEELIVIRPTATRELADLVKSVISNDEFRLENPLAANPGREHWRKRITEDLAWFYELPDIVSEMEEANDRELDLQKVYAWAERETRPVQFMRGPMLGVANRRRIWVPCKLLAAAYLSKVPQDWDGISEKTENSEEED